MTDSLRWLFSSQNFMPHGHCFLWQPSTLWLNVGSDALIASAYFAIPLVIFYFTRRRPAIRYGFVPLMFATFILLCGTTHVMEILTVWNPLYRVAGALKLVTGVASIGTLLALVWIMPRALLLKTPKQLHAEVEARTSELYEVNVQLRSEIAARDAAESELRSNNQLLARSNRNLEDFAYVASHDLKAPLSGINSAATWLEEDLQDSLSEESRKTLGLMRGRINRMDKLLDDLLTYSRAGRTDTEVTETNVADIFASIVEILSPPAHIKVRFEGELPVIFTASAQLEQVLRNLINNAIKHHDKQSGEVVLSAAHVGNFVEFCVRDDGPGILPQFHVIIFQLFQTLRRRDEVEGSGMGLAMVKKLVEQQNSRITVHSKGDGTGTEFRFHWPTLPSSHGAKEPPNARTENRAVAAR